MGRFLASLFFVCLTAICFSQDRTEGELHVMDSLIGTINDETLPDTSKVRARLSLALYYYATDLDTTFILCHEAEELAEKNQWDFGMTESYGWLGYLYNATGNLEKALEYNNKSMVLAKKTGDIISITTLLNNSAIIYLSWGKTEEALKCHIEALQLHESSGNKVEIARSLNSIALIMKNQGFIDKALDLYERSLKMRREIGEPSDIGETLNNIGVIYAVRKEYKVAEEYYKESLRLRMENGKPTEVANSLNNLGNLMNNMEMYDSALVYLFQSLEIREKYGLAPGICESSIDIGYAYYQKGDYQKAKEYSLKGYEMAKDFGYIRLITNATGTIYKLYLEENNKALAYDYFYEHVSMRDSMQNSETQRTTAQMEAKYAYEKQKAMDDANYEKEKAIGDEQKKRQQILIYSGGAGLVLVIGFLIFVFNRLRITRKQKGIIEEQKIEVEQAHEILEEKNTEILDSIAYAKRIQSAILPPDKLFKSALPNSFVLYIPKDIVAGDFYWMEQKDGKTLFAAADCTGHGVPGAMVSVICNNGLNRSVRENGLTEPGEILDKTREIVIQEFEKSDEEVKDGMDIALCSLEGMNLRYAGAHNPLWVIRNGEIIEIKADKQPVGKFDQLTPYTTHEFQLQAGDAFYIFSDGFADQFGGERGKKMKSKGFKEELLSIQQLSMDEQQKHLLKAFHDWRGDFEQLDDVCVIGVKV